MRGTTVHPAAIPAPRRPVHAPVPNPRPDRPALERLAAHIRSLPTRPVNNRFHGEPNWTPLDPNISYFDWANWSGDDHTEHSCGTFGCVAGHAIALFPDLLRVNKHGSVEARFDNWVEPLTVLGLDKWESRAITLGYSITHQITGELLLPNIDKDLSKGTAEEAADRILAVLALAEARFERLSLDTAAPPSVPSAP